MLTEADKIDLVERMEERFREAVLESGGSRTALENFKAFRGREPSMDALLRHQGMAG